MIDISHVFAHHSLDAAQLKQVARVREAAIAFARVIESSAPSGADKEAAILLVRDAMMKANASIATDGRQIVFPAATANAAMTCPNVAGAPAAKLGPVKL